MNLLVTQPMAFDGNESYGPESLHRARNNVGMNGDPTGILQ